MKICIIHINASAHTNDKIEEPPQRFMRGVTPYMALKVHWGVVRLMDDELPKIHDYDGYLITGGSAPLVDEEHPRVTILLDFIRQLNDAKIPLVGICWGHQGICKALGGTVEKFEKKYGMGIKTTQVVSKYDWMKQAPDSVNLYSMHTCQVTVPPKGAELFLSSDFCRYAGFVLGNHILTIQQHPDYNLNVSLEMINKRSHKLSSEELDIALKSLSKPHHTELACQWIGQFLMQHA